jgi:hypothetical protein
VLSDFTLREHVGELHSIGYAACSRGRSRLSISGAQPPFWRLRRYFGGRRRGRALPLTTAPPLPPRSSRAEAGAAAIVLEALLREGDLVSALLRARAVAGHAWALDLVVVAPAPPDPFVNSKSRRFASSPPPAPPCRPVAPAYCAADAPAAPVSPCGPPRGADAGAGGGRGQADTEPGPAALTAATFGGAALHRLGGAPLPLGARVGVRLVEQRAQVSSPRNCGWLACPAHPHVAPLLLHSGNSLFLLPMQFALSGGALAGVLARSPLAARQKRLVVLRAGLHLAWALEHLHAHGIWHLDVKPDNLLVSLHGLRSRPRPRQISGTASSIDKVFPANYPPAAAAAGARQRQRPRSGRFGPRGAGHPRRGRRGCGRLRGRHTALAPAARAALRLGANCRPGQRQSHAPRHARVLGAGAGRSLPSCGGAPTPVSGGVGAGEAFLGKS